MEVYRYPSEFFVNKNINIFLTRGFKKADMGFYVLIVTPCKIQHNRKIYKYSFHKKSMTNIIQDVKPTETASAYVEKPFDQAKVELEAVGGYDIISLEDNAKLRIAMGTNHSVSQRGNYTREGFLYVPQKGIFLVKNSPIMANAKEATKCHRNGREFYLTGEQVEEALKDSVKIKSGDSIPTKRFGEDELTRYAFGETAQAYGDFLKQAKINEMPVWLASVEKKPFARQAWLHRLGGGGRSVLYGYYWFLSYYFAVRGVRNTSADEGSASAPRKIISVEDLLNKTGYTSDYAPSQIKKLQNILEEKGYVITKK